MFDRNRYNEKKADERRKTEEFLKKKKEANFEKGDLFALILAALTTVVPIALLAIFLIYFLTLAVFGFFRW